MKSKNLVLGLALVAMGFVSCKDEAETTAEKTVDTYVVYVDSLGNIQSSDAKANWAAIEADYQRRTSEAEAALANLKDKTAAQERLDASRARYEELKAKVQAELDKDQAATTTATTGGGGSLRTTLFGGKAVGDDMTFMWVNKDNIREVYENFIENVQDNKDSYSREDWDEIKLLYEALDTRKNTVEKEGLSSDDNRKISAAKIKFAPMYTTNRMGAKSAENQNAKE
ncbi:MAG TPA: DUF6565 domain-containing protein [Flavobacterium sp.]|jgi:hypothetical protein